MSTSPWRDGHCWLLAHCSVVKEPKLLRSECQFSGGPKILSQARKQETIPRGAHRGPAGSRISGLMAPTTQILAVQGSGPKSPHQTGKTPLPHLQHPSRHLIPGKVLLLHTIAVE